MASNDEKVVSLKFDNAKFEKNIRQSMNSLDEFDKRCDSLGGSDVNMSKLQNAFKQTEITATQAGFHIRDVWLKVASVLEYKIARKIVDVGEKIGKALTLEGINDGLSEYEMQMNSVQTIMANTGANVQTVNKYLDQLNEYADKTIYNFSQMTRNIGLFTAAGVGLKESTNAIKGIANLAAVSGSDSTKASMAMYQLSQALATGTVRLQDWNSVVNAGMGGKVFQTALIRTSEIMGTGAEEAIKHYGSFRDSLTKGAWLTSEVLSETLAQISGAYTEAELIEKGYNEQQVQDILKLAATAEAAATDVKTFTQLIDTVKEAIGSGWALSFRTIVGNFEEAKELYSAIGKIVNGIIDRQSDARNAMLQGWKDMGGRTDIINTLINLYNAVNTVIIPIKEAFNDIFGWRDGSLQLKNMSRALDTFTGKLKLSGAQMVKVRKIFTAIFTTADTIGQVFSSLAKAILGVFKPFVPVGDSVLDILATIADVITNLNRQIQNSGLIDLLGKELGNGIKTVAGLIGKLVVGVVKLMTALVKLPQVQLALKLIGAILVNMVSYVANVIDKLAQGKSIIEALNLPAIVDILGRVLNIIGLLAGTAIGGAISGIKLLADAFLGLFDSGEKVDTISKDFVKNYGDNAGGVVQTIERSNDSLNKSTSILQTYKEKISNALNGILTSVKDFFENFDLNVIKEKLSSAVKIVSAVLSALVIWKMSSAIMQLGNALGELADMLEEQRKAILISNIKSLATSILYFAAALAILGKLTLPEVGQGFGFLFLISALLVGITALLKKIGVLNLTAFQGIALTFVALSGSILMMVVAVKSLAYIPWKKLMKAGIEIFGLMATLVGAVVALKVIVSKFEGSLTQVTIFFATLGTSLLLLAGSLLLFAVIPYEAFVWGFIRVMAVLGMIEIYMIGLMEAQKKFSSFSGVAATIMAFAGSILILIGAIAMLSDLEWPEFLSNLGKIAVMMLVMAGGISGLYFALSAIQKGLDRYNTIFNNIGFAAAILAFSGMILAVSSALETLAHTNWADLLAGFVTLALLIGEIGAVMIMLGAQSANLGPNFVKIAFSFGIIALAINLLVPAILMMTALNTLNPIGTILSTIEVMGVLYVLFKLLGTISGENSANLARLIGMIAVIGVLGFALYELGEQLKQMDAGQIMTSLIGLSFIIAAMGMAVAMMNKIKLNVSAIVTCLAIAVALCSLIVPLVMLSEFDWALALTSMLGLSAVVLAMANAIKILDNLTDARGILALGSLSIVLLLLGASLHVLSGLKLDQIGEGLIGVAIALGILIAAAAGAEAFAIGLGVLSAALVSIAGAITMTVLAFTAFLVAWTIFIMVVKEGALEVVEAINLLAEGIIMLSPKVFTAATLLGAAISGGLIAGLIGGIGLAIAALLTACNDLEGTFRMYWGINSPSTKMAELGGYLMQGLVQGLSDNGGVTQAGSEMANGFIDNLKSIWEISSPSAIMEYLGKMLVGGLTSGISTNIASALVASGDLGTGVLNEVGSYINYNNGFDLGLTFGGGTLDGIQSLLSSYGLSLGMLTSVTYDEAQYNKVTARQKEILDEQGAAWQEYKDALAYAEEHNSLSPMDDPDVLDAYQKWQETIDKNAEELKSVTEERQALMDAKAAEEAAAAAEEKATQEAILQRKASAELSQREMEELSVADQKQLLYLRDQKLILEEQQRIAEEAYKEALWSGTADEIAKASNALDQANNSLSLVENAIGELELTEEEAIDTTEDFGDAMEDAGGKAGKSAEEVEEALDTIQDLLDKYAEAWVSKRDEIMQAFNPFEAAEVDTNEVGSIEDMMHNLQTQLDRNASWGAVSDTFYNRLEAIGAAVGNEAGADLAQEWLAGLDAGSTEEIRALNSASDEELIEFVNMFSTAYGQAGHLANIELNKMKEDTEKELADLLNVVSIRLEDVVNVFDGTAESFAALQDLANNDWYQKAINNIPLLSEDVKDALEDGWSLEQLVAFGNDAVDNVNQSLLDAVANQEDVLNETGSELAAGMLDGVTKEFEEGKSLEEAQQAMATALADPKAGALLNLKEALEIGSPSELWAREIGWWLFKGIVKGIWDLEGDSAEQIEVLDAAMQAMLDHVKEWVNTFGIETLHETGAQMTEYLIDTVGGMQSGVPVEHLKQAVDNLSDIATDQFEDHRDGFYEVGVNLIQGLIDGMNSMEEQLKTAAANLALAAETAAKNASQEASPSKVWARIGAFLVEGLIVGMDSRVTSLEESTEDLVTRSNEAASLIAATMATALADDDYQPRITPIVDLSEIQNGAYEASRLWNNSPAVNLSAAISRNEQEARAARLDSENGDPQANGSGGIYFTQNNYSPKALSRLDIYRQTRNQIHQLKGVLS